MFFLIFAVIIASFSGCVNSQKEIAIEPSSKYFPENCWGVYSWAGWNTKEVSRESHPLIKGAPIILKWNDVEPEPGVFKFEELLDEKLKLADANDFYTFLMIWVAPNAPEWLYENGVPELEMTPTLNPLGQPRDWTFQYYLDEDYINYYHRLLKEFGAYLMQLPDSLRERVLYIQSAEGSTGDGGPYKGDPVLPGFVISNEAWGEFRIDAWEVLKAAVSDENGEMQIPLLVNFDSNSKRQYEWLLENLPVIGLKNGMFSHGYHISDTKSRLESWETFRKDVDAHGMEFFSRGEQDGEWAVYGWSTQNPEQAFYWSGIFATHCGLDMWNVPNEASAGYHYQDAINFFNKYAGHHKPSSAPAAFCALRKGLDASDTIAYPENIYGSAKKNNIGRYLNIAAAYKENGAMQGDPEKATGGGMVNRKRQDYNDVGWGILDGNYQRFISQIDAESTSKGWWHKGPEKSIYSRFARSIIMNEDKGAIYFDVNDLFYQNPVTLEIRVVYLDEGNSEWSFLYDSKKDPEKMAYTIKNENSGEWKEKTIIVKDAKFENNGERSSDISIRSVGKEDVIFHLIEVIKIEK